jgi:hypothetical protein
MTAMRRSFFWTDCFLGCGISGGHLDPKDKISNQTGAYHQPPVIFRRSGQVNLLYSVTAGLVILPDLPGLGIIAAFQ